MQLMDSGVNVIDILPSVTPTHERALFSLKVPRLSPLVLLKEQY